MPCSRSVWFALSSVAVAATLALGSTNASACLVCDEVIELDQPRASCFSASYDRFLSAARNSPSQSAQIDLSECVGASGTENRGLDRIGPSIDGNARTMETQPQLRSVYILDEAGIVCLKGLLDDYEGAYDPARFDLYESCGQ